ncbi:MAG TPA: ADP-ribosylglycohydrolase family protein, partial [Acidimicrobiia bacterium]|nr:ADP-ribosylglycohydrolase family protein [Acidimicrobiia bacterium]
ATLFAALSDPRTPLFSLLNGEGAGAMLAAAAGDVAGGASQVGYSALTQQATMLAYHLLRHNTIDRPTLADDWLDLWADEANPSVYRAPSAQFVGWLEATVRGEAAATAEPSAEPAARVHPVGVWFRRDPGQLVGAAISMARITHIDATTVVNATAVAGAVAASAFAQAGRDLLIGTAEVCERALAEIEAEGFLYSRVEEARQVPSRLRKASDLVGLPAGELGRQLSAGEPTALDWPIIAIVLAADTAVEPYRLIETAATWGGGLLAVMVGSMVGARVGLRSWPWVVPNDTWFAEIGRRLVNGNRETRDIPVPYQVEERLTYGIDTRFS